jgi:hypothetical protein
MTRRRNSQQRAAQAALPRFPDVDSYLVIDDTDENASQILFVALDGLRLATWRRSGSE